MYYKPQSEHVVSKVLDGEAIVINLMTGIYYSMESVSAKISRDLCSGVSLSDLLSDSVSKYPNQLGVTADINSFVENLTQIELLQSSDLSVTPDEELDVVAWPEVYVAPEIQSFDDVAAMVALDPPLPELKRYSSDL